MICMACDSTGYDLADRTPCACVFGKMAKERDQETERQAYERRLHELSEPPYGIKITINQEPLDYWQTPSK